MAGLLQQGMAPQGGQPSPQAQPGQPPQQPGPQGQPQHGGGSADMDPQQGPQQRDQLVNAMLEMLYGPMLEQARKILQQHQDSPEQGIGRIVAQLITVTWKKLAEGGKTAPPGVIVQAAMVVSQAVGEMAIRLRMLDEQDGDTIEKGFMLGMGEFGKATAQEMPPEHRQRYSQLIQAIAEGKQKAGGQRPPEGGAPPQAGPAGPPGAPPAAGQPQLRDPRGGM
ncbi:hypothetical protein M8009_13120 [Halomonas sp. ATCH28]|uniref:Uncharacterized protein n=1 Tax=Halomonas gemina TaxID=2945105 RepID=A0ABT0T374_9GAMM|nr:hypothetical protein [Halomonas gemina]MCL7941228.1 hypothetical protein [Halomonas gemina]